MSKKYIILSGLFMVLSLKCHGAHGEEKNRNRQNDERETFVEQTPHEGLETQELARKWPSKENLLRGFAWGTVSQVTGFALTYQNDASFKEYVDRAGEKTRDYLLRTVVLPAHLKVEEIRDEGVSSKDLCIAALCVVGAYGVKKTCDFFSLWQAILGDTSKTKEAAALCVDFVKKHKIPVSCVAVAFITLLGAWRIAVAMQKQGTISCVDQFHLSLTNEQRMKIMESQELEELLALLKTDPFVLTTHKSFMSLLTIKQKELLERIIYEYINNNPHLGLLEEGL